MADELILTVGPAKDGRRLAIITTGGHPRINADVPCTILTVELVSRIPDQDVNAWFKRMQIERPWESRQ